MGVTLCIDRAQAEGSFFKLSVDADSYRAELLGLLALHILLDAIQLFYKIEDISVKL